MACGCASSFLNFKEPDDFNPSLVNVTTQFVGNGMCAIQRIPLAL